MEKDEVCKRIREIAIVPAVRVLSGDDAHFAAEAVMRAGIPIVEITLTVPGAAELMTHLVRSDPNVIVGAGTVLDIEIARQCVDAGAKFLTSPTFDPAIIEFGARQGVAVLPGAMTPTEVLAAWNAGADFVKVFPCSQIGGEKYIKSLSTSLPQIPLIAAGGINQQTAGSYILSGAAAIGLGKELIPAEAMERRQSDRIRELAQRFSRIVKDAREQIEAWKRNVVVKGYTGTERCEK